MAFKMNGHTLPGIKQDKAAATKMMGESPKKMEHSPKKMDHSPKKMDHSPKKTST